MYITVYTSCFDREAVLVDNWNFYLRRRIVLPGTATCTQYGTVRQYCHILTVRQSECTGDTTAGPPVYGELQVFYCPLKIGLGGPDSCTLTQPSDSHIFHRPQENGVIFIIFSWKKKSPLRCLALDWRHLLLHIFIAHCHCWGDTTPAVFACLFATNPKT